MSTETLLAICIPTYRRTNEIIGNLKKMDFRDPRVVFVVSSNCDDSELSAYCDSRPDIHFFQSEVNRGFSANLFETLKDVKSLFSLIMSDEDFLDSDNLDTLLTRLEETKKEELQYLITTNDQFSLSSMRKMIGKKLTYLNVLLTNPHIPTYMSGFIYPADRVAAMVTKIPPNKLNAYPFLILRNQLLSEHVPVHILSEVTITRGPDSVNRDLEANYVDESIAIDRTNYFLSHYRNLQSHNWLLELWVASLILAQSRPGIKSGYLRLKLIRDTGNMYIGIGILQSPDLGTKLSHIISEAIVYCSHVYRRVAIH